MRVFVVLLMPRLKKQHAYFYDIFSCMSLAGAARRMNSEKKGKRTIIPGCIATFRVSRGTRGGGAFSSRRFWHPQEHQLTQGLFTLQSGKTRSFMYPTVSEAEGIEYEEEGCCGGTPYVRRLTMRQFWLSSPKLRYIFPPSSLCIR